MLELIDQTKAQSIPAEWTEDSPARSNARLNQRFELGVSDDLRNRAKFVRSRRNETLDFAQKYRGMKRLPFSLEYPLLRHGEYVPLEVLEVSSALWIQVTSGLDSSCLAPLSSTRVPTSQEICVAAASNQRLAAR